MRRLCEKCYTSDHADDKCTEYAGRKPTVEEPLPLSPDGPQPSTSIDEPGSDTDNLAQPPPLWLDEPVAPAGMEVKAPRRLFTEDEVLLIVEAALEPYRLQLRRYGSTAALPSANETVISFMSTHKRKE